MTDQLVDTNVLIVASAASEPRYPDVSVGIDEVERVYEWLQAFRDDPERQMVLDETFGIYDEYQNKLTGQHFGLQVIHHKMNQFCLRQVPVEYDHEGHGVVPEALSPIDKSDRKFVAAALHDVGSIEIVNATDGDWQEQRDLLEAHGVYVLELLR